MPFKTPKFLLFKNVCCKYSLNALSEGTGSGVESPQFSGVIRNSSLTMDNVVPHKSPKPLPLNARASPPPYGESSSFSAAPPFTAV
uniref:Uncharacterized protein n=1 Tax=Romanomermis culicivorax TaxID=13658 RepID=A0A915J4R7_ROMCU